MTEIELRGGRPFSTAILYEDLVGRAARLVERRRIPWARVRSQLEPHAYCFACDYVAGAGNKALRLDRAHWEEAAERVNRRERAVPLVRETRDEWLRYSCPLCLGGVGPVCRQHLVDGAEPSGELGAALEQLRRRLRAFIGSMTFPPRPTGRRETASWIEALGWFGGWDYARKLELDGS